MIPFKFDNGGILDEQLHLDSAKMILTKSVIRPLVMSNYLTHLLYCFRIDNFRAESVSGTCGPQIGRENYVFIWVAWAWGRWKGDLYGVTIAVIFQWSAEGDHHDKW